MKAKLVGPKAAASKPASVPLDDMAMPQAPLRMQWITNGEVSRRVPVGTVWEGWNDGVTPRHNVRSLLRNHIGGRQVRHTQATAPRPAGIVAHVGERRRG